MKKDLLICITYHHNKERLQYLHSLLANFANTYECSLDVVIHTNSKELNLDDYPLPIKIIVHENLGHPFFLAWRHREYIKQNIDNYEVFYYTEDDILLPYENYLNYLDTFKLLFPLGFVPAMIRIEEKDGEQFVTDIIEPQKREKFIQFFNGKSSKTVEDIVKIKINEYIEIKPTSNYNGFWIMPGKELKETMLTNFDREHQSREHAASYVAWELQKPTMIQIKDGEVSPLCYSYHLPNNYAISPESKNAKIKPKNIFK